MIDLGKPGVIVSILAHLAGTLSYRGLRVEGNTVVTADGKELSPRPSQRVRNHSPDGFNWGYQGSGPAQLALAILLYEGLRPEIAELFYQSFKRRFVAHWDHDTWELSGDALRLWIRGVLEKRAEVEPEIWLDEDTNNA